MKNRIIFWQNIPSIHQLALLREVACVSNARVALVVEKEISERRKKQGWSFGEVEGLEVVVAPSTREVREFLGAQPGDAIHVVSGYSHPFMRKVIPELLSLNDANLALMAESNRFYRVREWANALRGRWFMRDLGKQVRAVLAIGHLGMEWYRMLGVSEGLLFPFGYFVESSAGGEGDERVDSGGVRFLFVGQHIDRKAGDLLIRALSRVGEEAGDWTLDFVGDGPRRKDWEKLVEGLGVGERVRFCGVVPNRELKTRMGSYDCLILPSLWDGWGAVTNEALISGLKVISSDKCGSAVLLSDPRRGEVFQANSVKSLRGALRNQIQQGPLSREQRHEIREWAQNISPRAAAKYMCEVLSVAFGGATKRQAPPIPPWFQ